MSALNVCISSANMGCLHYPVIAYSIDFAQVLVDKGVVGTAQTYTFMPAQNDWEVL